jgi:integrase
MSQPFMRGGVWQFRRKVPEDLVPIVGKREVKQSLKTRDPAVMKLRHAEALAESERLFARARAQLSGVSSLTPQDAEQLASRWYVSETLRLDRTGGFTEWLVPDRTLFDESDGSEVVVYATPQDVAEQEDEEGKNVLDPRRVAIPYIEAALRQGSVLVPAKGSREWSWLVAEFALRVNQLSAWALERQEGRKALPGEGALPHAPLSNEVPAPAPPVAAQALTGRTISKLFAAYETNKLAGDDSRSVKASLKDYSASIATFIELFGDVDVSLITQDMASEFRVLLTKLPANGKGMGKLSARAKMERTVRDSLPTISAGTVRNRMRHLSATLGYGVTRGWIAKNPINSGIGREVAQAATKQQATNRRRNFYQESELVAIFSSEAFTNERWAPPRAMFGRAWYWLPVLMFYTGARIEELAQLLVSEVKQDQDGIHYVSILESTDGADAGRTVKNSGSRRRIPLHADVIARGFLDYAGGLPAVGKLFPGLEPCPKGRYSTNFGKRWCAYLRDTVHLVSPAYPAHGFRHTFKTLARQVKMSEEVHDAITGHSKGGVGRSYGEMPLSAMASELARFPSISEMVERARAIEESGATAT